MFEELKYNLRNNRRGLMKSATAWFIFTAIILVFVFWGLTPHHQGVAEGGTAAAVNNASISLAQLSEFTERLRRDPRFEQLQSLGGEMGNQVLQQQALSQLIEMELIRQQTDEQRLWTTDAEVREVITSIPQFQEDGRFKREQYMGYLKAVRKTPAEFEDEVRREQSLRRTVRFFNSALRPTSGEVEKKKMLDEMKANLEFIAIPVETLVIPEMIKSADVETFLAKEGSAAEVKSYYDSHKADFSKEEQVKARHILIMASQGDAEAEKKAREKIEGLAKRAKGEDFGKLAGEFSEDPGSKSKGGDLGFFSRGRMVKEFEDVAFSAPVNEVSPPVKTQYGYHLIQVLEKKPAMTRTLDDAREDIAEILIAKERSKAAIDGLQESMKKGDSGAVARFIAEHKLKWEETGAFTIESENVPKIGASDDVIRQAFSLTPENPMPSGLVRQGPTSYVIRYKALPVSSTKDGDKKKSEEKPELLAELMANRRSEDALRQWIDGLRKDARISMNNQLLNRGRAASPSQGE